MAPDNLKHIQDLDVPFIVGMVAQAKEFIIDKAMMALICSSLAAGVIGGKLLHEVSTMGESQVIMQSQMMAMTAKINEMTLVQNTLSSNVGYATAAIKTLTTMWNKHLEGHPVRFIP